MVMGLPVHNCLLPPIFLLHTANIANRADAVLLDRLPLTKQLNTMLLQRNAMALHLLTMALHLNPVSMDRVTFE
jgi:hypothetical protein